MTQCFKKTIKNLVNVGSLFGKKIAGKSELGANWELLLDGLPKFPLLK